jgi:mevalonate kinase
MTVSPSVDTPADGGPGESGTSSATGTGSAHAKFILLGEHAVVYGRPAIGMPLPRMWVRAEARLVDGPLRLETDTYTGALNEAQSSFDTLGAAVRNTLKFFGHAETGVTVSVHGEIPIGRGLGSSAAVAHAIVESIRELLGAELDEDERFELVQSAERVAHGTPSGLDARATREPGPFLFENGAVTGLDVGFGGAFVIADTGVRGSTKTAVGDVAAFGRARPERSALLLDQLEQLTRDAAADLADDRREALGSRMTRAHRILSELGAGHESIDRLVDAAVAAGALGAKLTGGGQGGCVVALVRTAEEAAGIVEALGSAGAVACWVVTAAGEAPESASAAPESASVARESNDEQAA